MCFSPTVITFYSHKLHVTKQIRELLKLVTIFSTRAILEHDSANWITFKGMHDHDICEYWNWCPIRHSQHKIHLGDSNSNLELNVSLGVVKNPFFSLEINVQIFFFQMSGWVNNVVLCLACSSGMNSSFKIYLLNGSNRLLENEWTRGGGEVRGL